MPSHPIDFQIQSDIFSTPESSAIFSETRRFSRWLQIEAALARTQGELGIIPAAAAEEIASCADIKNLDLIELSTGYQKSRNSIMPVIKALRQACRADFGEYVHYGATTQDILDTSQILEIKDCLNVILAEFKRLEAALIELSSQHRQTPMIGRTHGQQALPITFGFKTAGWLAEVRRHIERIKHLAPRLLVGQLSGAVGTMAALGPQGREVSAGVMKKLGLGSSIIGWHTLRDNIAETASFFSMIGATLEKIANEIFELGKTEIGELREPAPSGAASSSTMPHKRNPVISQRIAVLGRHIRALAPITVDSMVHEHERDARALWSEMLAFPQISIYSCTALHYTNQVISGLEVNTSRMIGNLYLHKDMVVSEWLLFRLGKKIGKMKAQEILQEMFQQVYTANKPLRQCLEENQQATEALKDEDLTLLDHPERYRGLAVEIIDDVIAETRIKQQSDPESF